MEVIPIDGQWFSFVNRSLARAKSRGVLSGSSLSGQS